MYSASSVAYLGKIHAERVHVQTVEKTGEALAESRQTLVHQLQVHEIGLEIRHRVRQLCELRFQGIDGRLGVASTADVGTVAMCFSDR